MGFAKAQPVDEKESAGKLQEHGYDVEDNGNTGRVLGSDIFLEVGSSQKVVKLEIGDRCDHLHKDHDKQSKNQKSGAFDQLHSMDKSPRLFSIHFGRFSIGVLGHFDVKDEDQQVDRQNPENEVFRAEGDGEKTRKKGADQRPYSPKSKEKSVEIFGLFKLDVGVDNRPDKLEHQHDVELSPDKKQEGKQRSRLGKKTKEKVGSRNEEDQKKEQFSRAPFRNEVVVEGDEQKTKGNRRKPGIWHPFHGKAVEKKRVADGTDDRVVTADEKTDDEGK